MTQITYKYHPRVDEDDEDDEDRKLVSSFTKKRPYSVYDTTYSAQVTHLYLSEEIGAPEEYTDIIHKIYSASSSDVIHIHLNTPGGRLDTGVQLINAMHNSAARIVTILDAEAYSLGTLIFLAGDEMIVNDHCLMMFHNFKGGVVGKGNEQIAQLDATIKWFNALAKKIYVPFLTEEEFQRIVKGEDLWMQSVEIRRRLDKAYKDTDTPKKKVKSS